MDFDVKSRTVDAQTAILAPVGEVDLLTAPRVKERIAQLTEEGINQIIVDCSRIEYLDSTGLGVLVGALKRLREQEGDLRLVNPGDRLMRVLEITRLVNVFPIHATEDEALSSLAAGGASPQ